MMGRIGLFGGTFDPIHNGHISIAREVRERCAFDQILFIPAGQPPYREAFASPLDRLQMTRLACAPYPYFEVTDVEVTRPGKSYSIETVSQLRSKSGADLFFILGLDAFLDVHQWKEAERLLSLCTFVVVSRPPALFSQISSLPFFTKNEDDRALLARLDSGEQAEGQIRTDSGYSLSLIRVAPCPISSKEIRHLLAGEGEGKNLLPEAVLSYIIKNRVYKRW